MLWALDILDETTPSVMGHKILLLLEQCSDGTEGTVSKKEY